MLMATLSGIEMTLDVSAVPHKKGGVQAAIDYIATQAQA
jgi:alanine-glyoxylate transaminase/serine-glyoxylate transaminase/serine-pyruvate transaminase